MAGLILSLNTSTIQPAPLIDKIRIAGETGYRAIELWTNDIDAYIEQGGKMEEIVHALQDHGLAVPTVINLTGWLDAEDGTPYRAALDEAKRRMDQAATVGAVHIVAGPPRHLVDFGMAAARYKDLLALGRAHGVRPAMEFLGFVNGIHTIDAAMEIVNRADDPDGTIVLDPFHIYRGGSPVEAIERVPVERIAVFHFNDATDEKPRETQVDADRVLPGDGILPLVDELRGVWRRGYRGAVSLELFNQALWARNPRDVAQEGFRRLAAIVRDAGAEAA